MHQININLIFEFQIIAEQFKRLFFDFLVGKLSSTSTSESVNSTGTSDIVLVAGGTGGVGRRVVNVLWKKGIPVRVLVRNEEKARKMLGSDVDL
ncbi:hypothetical protein L195_g024237, partial [Trifolium pratense]